MQLLRQAGHPWAQERHQHGPACGHQGEASPVQRSARDEAVQRIPESEGHAHGHEAMADSSPAVQKALLDAAMASPSRSLPEPLLAEAMPFFQNPNLAAAQLHDNPVAQRATAALGARAMTVGTHIFASPQVVADKGVMGHELSHVNENLKGTPETGNNNGAGVTITDPNQGSEQKAERDGASFGARGATAPSVVTQRALTQDVGSAAVNENASTAGGAVQRMESPSRGRRSSGEGDYEADASASDSGGSVHGRDSDGSPERRELLSRTEQELVAGGGLDDLVGRTERLGLGPSTLRRIRAIHNSDSEDQARPAQQAAPQGQARASQSSESDSDSSAGSAEGLLSQLPETNLLRPFRDLLVAEVGKGSGKKLKVTFQVQGTSPRGGSGHAWIEITGSDGEQTSFGFYPEEGGYERLSSVQGGVHCPDGYSGRGRATHHESKKVALEDVIKGYQIAHDRVLANYNFTLHNCSTFAGDAWKAMTGKAIPREWFTRYGMLSLVVATPQGAAEGLEAHQTRRHQERTGRGRRFAEGPMRVLAPGAEQETARHAAAMYSESSSSKSSDEVD
ncbi:DUF4157 domain-containing protein [Streptomyces sp. NBC_01390]|uniref:eCIS core domain-containing protein n=1 Tax=Streptomyces sp. NBC_01390 TaxID=2903850 RepID=UPI0032462E68